MIPWTTNAQIVFYNKTKFTELGLKVPSTWDEFIKLAEAIKDKGEQPFIYTWKDAWTAKLLVNSLAGPTQGDDFWQKLQKGTVTFSGSDAYKTTAKRMLELKQYAQNDPFGTSYDDGNSQFANGGSVLCIQGTWAIPVMKSVNPDIELGTFVLPTENKPDTTKLLSAPRFYHRRFKFDQEP